MFSKNPRSPGPAGRANPLGKVDADDAGIVKLFSTVHRGHAAVTVLADSE